MDKQGLIKKLIADDKKSKKKVTFRADTVKARSLPMRCRSGERGGKGEVDLVSGVHLNYEF